jgi:4-hydroxy-3-methylbut-2-enyl diphosphate reductase IspH
MMHKHTQRHNQTHTHKIKKKKRKRKENEETHQLSTISHWTQRRQLEKIMFMLMSPNELGVVVNTFNPSSGNAEAARSP